MALDAIQKQLLREVADLHDVPEGAYNIRSDGKSVGRSTTANIDIVTKTDKPGIDIIIAPGTKKESVHIPVIISESGLQEMVYNDFIIGEDADVVIVAGCGIHNCGDQEARHDGIHTFHVGKNAKVRYVEKHYADGDGNGAHQPVARSSVLKRTERHADGKPLGYVVKRDRKDEHYNLAKPRVLSIRLTAHAPLRVRYDLVAAPHK
jgi:Fe-S cluster assembly scaffold protein SufB